MCLTPPREWMNVSQCTIHGRDRDVRCLAFFSFLSLPLLCFIPCLAPGDFTCHLLSFNFFNSFLLSAVSTTHPVVSLLTLAYPPCLAASELSYPTNWYPPLHTPEYGFEVIVWSEQRAVRFLTYNWVILSDTHEFRRKTSVRDNWVMRDTMELTWISLGFGAFCWLPSRLPIPWSLASHPSGGAPLD